MFQKIKSDFEKTKFMCHFIKTIMLFGFSGFLLSGCGAKVKPAVSDPSQSDLAQSENSKLNVTYETHTKIILDKSCISCHSFKHLKSDRRGAPTGVDYNTYKTSKANASQGNQRIQSNNMPPAESININDKAIFQQWIDSGVKKNNSSQDHVNLVKKKSRFHSLSNLNSERTINILSAQTTKKKSLLMVIDHRAFKSFLSKEGALNDFLGLDAGTLKIGIGFRYGIFDFLDIGYYRLSNGADAFDTYEFDMRAQFLNEKDHYINMATKAGVTWFSWKDSQDTVGFFGQLMLDKVLINQLKIGVGFGSHSNSSNEVKTTDDINYSGAVLGYIEWRAPKVLALGAEISMPVFGYTSAYPTYAFAVKFMTYRHAFSLVVSNSQYMSTDGLVAGSNRYLSNLIFGFQILREFHLGSD